MLEQVGLGEVSMLESKSIGTQQLVLENLLQQPFVKQLLFNLKTTIVS